MVYSFRRNKHYITELEALCWDYYDLCVNAFKNQKENAKQ